MKRKILRLFLAFILVTVVAATVSLTSYAEDDGYGIWVNGEEFTSEKTVIQCGEGYAELDADAEPKVVTLDNAVITKGMTYTNVNGEHMAGIRAAEDLVIEVVGDNLIRLPAKNSAVSITGVDSTSDVTVTSEGYGYLRIETGEPKTDGDSIGFATDKITTIDGFVIVDVSIPSARGIGYSGGFAIAGESTFAAECGRIALYGKPNIDNYASTPWIYSNESGSIKEIDLRIVDDFYAEADQATFALIGNYEYKERDVYVDNIGFTSFRETVFCKAGKAYLDVNSTPYELTLSNVVITNPWKAGEYPAGVRAFCDLDVVLDGYNYIKLDSDSSADSINGICTSYGSYKGVLKITGDGFLRIELGTADGGNGYSTGISAMEGCTIEEYVGISIDATRGSKGIGIDSSLIFNDFASLYVEASKEALEYEPSFDNYWNKSPYIVTNNISIGPGDSGSVTGETWVRMSTEPYKEYSIYVNGKMFNADNRIIFCGTNGGYAAYNNKTKVVTLNNAYITSVYDNDDYCTGINVSESDVTIKLVGKNEIFLMDFGGFSDDLAGMYFEGDNPLITGDGSLEIGAYRADEDMYGFGIVLAGGDLTIAEGTEVIINTYDSAIYSPDAKVITDNYVYVNDDYDFETATQISDADTNTDYYDYSYVRYLSECFHKAGEETIPAVAATCTEAGNTAGKKCTVCDTVLEQVKEIPALGHKNETIPGKAPTCKTSGNTEGTVCSVCKTFIKEPEFISATGKHTADKGTVIAEPTYTTVGTKVYKCTVCGEETGRENIPQLEQGKVQSVAQTKADAKTISVVWTPVEGATSYVVSYSADGGKTWNDLTSVTGTQATIRSLKAETKYLVKIKAYKGKDEFAVSALFDFTTKAAKPAKVTLKSLKSAKTGQIVVTWNKVANVNGYEIICATDKKFKKDVKKATVKKAKKVKLTVKKLKKGKKYFVKVRAYKTVNGAKIYGAYSKIKTVKVK